MLTSAEAEGRADLVEVLKRAVAADAAIAREILRRAYFEGRVCYPGDATVDLPSLAGLPFQRQLASLAAPLLAGLHPRHREIAPRGELVGERLVRQLITDVIAPGRLGPAAAARGQLRMLVDGYLVPLGLARVRREGATVAPDPARSPAVAETLRLVDGGDPVPAVDVVRSLADGPVGLTEPESILVLNACVQTGLLEMWRGRNRLTEPFLAVTATDRLGAGELVEPAVRSAIAALAPIPGPGPFEPWTAGTRRSAWDHARAWLEARREELAQLRAGLARLSGIPALGGADPGPVLGDVSLIETLVEACPPALPAPAGLRALTAAIPEVVGPVLAAQRRTGAVARFLRDELRRVEEVADYLTHPELSIPASEEALQAVRDAALELLRDTLGLAAQDRIGDFFAAYREFRGAHLAAYQDAHDRHHTAVSPTDLDDIRATPGYRALARLSAIGAIAVPDDRVKVDRMLAGAVPRPCPRRVDVELGWKPRCACGFALGDREPALDRDAVVALAERGVRQHLAELARPEVGGRLDDAAADLAALGREELAADLRRLTGLDDGDPEAVASLLGDELVGVLRDVLTGGHLIVTRDLAVLREDLIGRRYPKRRLLELLTAWVDPTGQLPPGGFIEVVDSADSGRPEPAGASATPPVGDGAGTVAVLARRFPGLAALLPSHQAADAFWLAAWWGDRRSPPPWLPPRLRADPSRLAAAAGAAREEPAALADLADLDARIGPDTVLGDQ